MITTFIPPKKGPKNLIVNLLLSNGEQTTNELKGNLKHIHSTSISYQGIDKILHLLTEEKITKRNEKKWSIKKEWIESVVGTLQLSTGSETTIYTEDLQEIEFSSVKDTITFILNNIDNKRLHRAGEACFYMHMNNLGMCNYSKEHTELIKRIIKNNKTVFLVSTDNLPSRILGKYYKKMGGHVHLGTKTHPGCLTILVGSTVISVLSSPLRTFLSKNYQKIRNLSDTAIVDMFDEVLQEGKFKLKVKFETDPDSVHATKESFSQIMKNTPKI